MGPVTGRPVRSRLGARRSRAGCAAAGPSRWAPRRSWRSAAAARSLPVAGTLVDSNVLLDLFTEDRLWREWSETQLADALDRGSTLINPIIYAEISISFERIEELEQALPPELEREALPWEAAFLAGKCFLAYRRRGGERRSPLPGFHRG